MPLEELSSEDALRGFLKKHASGGSVVTFSAHWCGPCKASKPKLQAMAESTDVLLPMGIVYESDITPGVLQSFAVRAFPTYILFQQEKEVGRVEGADLEKVQKMMQEAAPAVLTGGEVLGGGGNTAVLTPAQAREARLAKLGGGNMKKPAAVPTPVAAPPAAAPTPMDVDEDKPKKGDETMEDVEMKKEDEPVVGPTAHLNADAITILTGAMGFSLLRAQKGLLHGGNAVEGAVEWIMQHQDDVDIDEPITAQVAQSYKCNDCGKILSNMANLELHANKTGHSDFEESTQSITPLTEEEKKEKILQIKELLKLKRAEREEEEKVDNTEREKQRRNMGKEMAKTREQLEMEQRKREAYLRKKQKNDFKNERMRLRMELEKDKAERAARGGRLQSRLGVEGYKPDGIQYDGDGTKEEPEPDTAAATEEAAAPKKKHKGEVARMDEYITKVASYRAGGDGERCLKLLSLYITNPVQKPEEAKFRSINTDNKTFKTKVKPFIGAKKLLQACGFCENDKGTALVLPEDADMQILIDAKSKLDKALQNS